MPQRPSEAIQELKTVFIGVAFQKFWPAHPTRISLTRHCVSPVKMSHPNRDLDWNGSSPVSSDWSATWVSATWVTDLLLSEHVFPNACPPPLQEAHHRDWVCNEGWSLHLRQHWHKVEDEGLWEPGLHSKGLNPDFWCYLQMRPWVELQDSRAEEDGFCTTLFPI